MNTPLPTADDARTILIIDDTPINLRVAVEYLESKGFRVLIAQDGQEGLTRAQLVGPDLILLDVMMPGIDGLETCRRLKANGTTWDIPVIFMTSLADPEAKVAGFRAGAVDYVSKPLQIDELTARVVTHLDIHAERQRARVMLHKREQEFRALVENSPDHIARLDPKCRILYANPTLQAMLDQPLRALLGMRPDQVLRDRKAAAAVQDGIAEVGRSAAPAHIEVVIDRAALAHGEGDIWHHIRLVPELDAEGRVASVLAVGRDITAIKMAERRLEDSNAQLRDLTRRRETAREEERKRIAREIHDELGQHLTALRMGISVLRLEFGADNPLLVERIGTLMTLADRSIQVVRGVASSLRPAVLDMGLASALEWLVDDFSRHSGIPCRLELPEDKIPLDDERATALFRIVQESLTNVARHAKAGRVDIVLAEHGPDYLLEVRDDGRGFEPGQSWRNAFGLLGMRERGTMLGGELTLDSAPGKGTRISVRVPVAAAGARP